jgi:hypothetical protein
MDEKQQMVTDSRYFSREFNTAIIDGPLRIYFADRQESDALKIYFDIQEVLANKGMKLDSISMEKPNMFLMLYPTRQTFKDAFQRDDEMAFGNFGNHMVLGVNGPYSEATRRKIGQQIQGVFVDGIRFHGALSGES